MLIKPHSVNKENKPRITRVSRKNIANPQSYILPRAEPASSKLKVGFQGRLSRILSRPKRTSAFIYLSDREIATRSPRKRSATHPGPMGGPPGPLFGLAPDWVYHAPLVALRAVSSYPTFSPLPCSFYPTGRFIFCDTIRHSQFEPKTPSLSRGILPFDVRTFLSNCKNQSECILPENRN